MGPIYGGAVAERSKALFERENKQKPKRSQVHPPGLGELLKFGKGLWLRKLKKKMFAMNKKIHWPVLKNYYVIANDVE